MWVMGMPRRTSKNRSRTSEQVLTVDQVAAYLQLNRLTVYRYLRDGRIPAARLGKVYRILKADVDRFLEIQKALPPPLRRQGEATAAAGVIARDRVRSIWVRDFKNPREIFVGPSRQERPADQVLGALNRDPVAVMAGVIRSLN
jgi:excisionase family DNA binding protein